MTNANFALSGSVLATNAANGDLSAANELARRLQKAKIAGKAYKVTRIEKLMAKAANVPAPVPAPAPEAPAPAPEAPAPEVIPTAPASTYSPIDGLYTALKMKVDSGMTRDEAILFVYGDKARREAIGSAIGGKVTQKLIAQACGVTVCRIAQILKSQRQATEAPAPALVENREADILAALA
tara:strand:+ start:15722 stop:16267 length:546 start_codon:yes stop_codon:yes gene_type:complete